MSKLVLVENQTPRAVIVLSADASPTERHAARELQAHLEMISTACLPIIEEAQSGPRIVIGCKGSTPFAANFDWDALGEDGCLIRTVGDVLVLSGAAPRGTLYAVYEFLERELGVRWLTASATHAPLRTTIAISNLDTIYVPPFRYREVFYAKGWDADWQSRHRLNGDFAPLDKMRGGRMEYSGFVHTFELLVPSEKDFDSHPEFFSLRPNPAGKMERTGIKSQLCLTNPEVLELVIARIREQLQNRPDARIVSVSQNDNMAHCLCDRCVASDEAEGSPSGTLLHFVNGVAARLESEYPQILFDTIVYQYTVVPPRIIRPRANVVVRLCHLTDVCDAHALEECEVNKPYVEQLKSWRAISPEVWVWDYFNTFNHYFLPYPNLDSLCADIPFYAFMGVTGIFAQADGTPPKGAGDVGELKAYVLARLLWNPHLDGREIVREFLELYYGAAANHLGNYLELLHAQVRDKPIHAEPYCDFEQPFCARDFCESAEKIKAAALQSVDCETTKARVEAAFLPLEYLWMKRHLRFQLEDLHLRPMPADARRSRRFLEIAKANGAGALYEGGRQIEKEIENLEGFQLIALENSFLHLRIAPAMGGRIVSLIEKNSGREWMFAGAPDDLVYPVAGGYEEYSEELWHSPGWNENHEFEADTVSIQLRADLKNGIRLERIYRFADGYSGLEIESKFSNISSESKTIVARRHAEFAVADWGTSQLLKRGEDGQREYSLPAQSAASGSLWLLGERFPNGAWGLKINDEILEMEFDADVEKCLLDWNCKDGVARFDLFNAARRLEPNEFLITRQNWTLKYITQK